MTGEVIHQFSQPLATSRGAFHVRVLGEQRADGTWSGWLEFTAPNGSVLTTGQETSQPDRDALFYWSTGLEPVFLEGALVRSRPL